MRDGLRAGTELGSIDWRRLVDSLELHQVSDGWRIGLGARGISAFETMLVQRAQHYRWVIHHPAAVAADAALTRCAEGVFDLATSPPPAEGADRAALADLGAVIPNLDYVDSAVTLRRAAGGMPRRRRLPGLAPCGSRAADRARESDSPAAPAAGASAAAAARRLRRLRSRAGRRLAQLPRVPRAGGGEPRRRGRPRRAGAAAQDSRFLVSAASREAAALMLTELPSRLNGALDELLDDDDQVGARRSSSGCPSTAPHVDGLGDGFWLVAPVGFLAVRTSSPRCGGATGSRR